MVDAQPPVVTIWASSPTSILDGGCILELLGSLGSFDGMASCKSDDGVGPQVLLGSSISFCVQCLCLISKIVFYVQCLLYETEFYVLSEKLCSVFVQ